MNPQYCGRRVKFRENLGSPGRVGNYARPFSSQIVNYSKCKYFSHYRVLLFMIVEKVLQRWYFIQSVDDGLQTCTCVHVP